MNKTFKLEFTQEQVDVLARGLMGLPFGMAAPVVTEFQKQINAQMGEVMKQEIKAA